VQKPPSVPYLLSRLPCDFSGPRVPFSGQIIERPPEKRRRSVHVLLARAMRPEAATKLKLQEEATASADSWLLTGIRPSTSRLDALPSDAIGALEVDEAASGSVVWRETLRRRLLGLADVTAAILVLLTVPGAFDQRQAAQLALAGALLLLLLFKVAGLYDRDDLRLVHSTLDEVPLLAQLTGVFALGVSILQTVGPGSAPSAVQTGVFWIASFGAILLSRTLARAVAGRTAQLERCLVLGDVDRVHRIRQKVAASRARALVIASLPLAGDDVGDHDWVAVPEIIRRVVSDLNVHRIIVAPSTTDSHGVLNLIRAAKAVGVRVSVLPRMFEVVGSAVEFDDVDGMTMLGVRRFGLSRSSRMLKRAFDLVLVSIGLVLISPVLIAIAIAIRLDSRGPVLFRQTRVGRDGNHFRMFKFRSMALDAERRKDELRSLNEAGDGLFKIADDPRVTRVGGVLRRTSLDELPQLFNVLCGQMSLVGPRPLVVDEDAQVRGLDRSRLHLTPGMTGPWQILGYRVPMQEMVGLDYLYVASWSLWLDLKVLLRTVKHVARRGNL
jgi:exopolysaccharide biosynthesis polyprenyl glycosylphosphotransferase